MAAIFCYLQEEVEYLRLNDPVHAEALVGRIQTAFTKEALVWIPDRVRKSMRYDEVLLLANGTPLTITVLTLSCCVFLSSALSRSRFLIVDSILYLPLLHSGCGHRCQKAGGRGLPWARRWRLGDDSC